MSSSQTISEVEALATFIRILLPQAVSVQLHQIVTTSEGLTVHVASTDPEAICPDCEQSSRRVQSRYTRTVADLPWGQCSIRLLLLVRRFWCRTESCARTIFTERLCELVQPYARRTTRLQRHVTDVAFALGGEAGARQCHSEGITISPDTLLVTMRRYPIPVPPTPRVLGVDDWSYRRGRQMGTILVDLERRCPIDLLPDSSEESFADWLREHPGVEIISRDRGEIYALGGRRGAPDATHVADRWHLFKNLGDAVVKLLARHTAALRQAAAHPCEELVPTSELVDTPPLPLKSCRKGSQPPPLSAQRQRQLQMYSHVQRLVQEGWTVAAMAQHLKLSPITVRKYRDMHTFGDQRTTARSSKLEPYRVYLEQRWAEGCTEAKQLWEEVHAHGYEGGYKNVWQFTRYWELPQTLAPPKPPPPPTAPTRTPRQAMWLLMRPTDDLSAQDAVYREHLVQVCPEVAHAENLVKEFGTLVRKRLAEELGEWIERATTSGIRELRRFALGLVQDKAAVDAAFSSEWSNEHIAYCTSSLV